MHVTEIPQFMRLMHAGSQVSVHAPGYFLLVFLLYVVSAAFAGNVSAVDIRVNAGGSQYTDGVGNVWSADTGFNTGRVSTAGVGAAIAGTTDDTLYQVQRFDIPAAPELIYSIAVPNGDYTVNLHFAENYAPAFNVGARVFSVQMEGATVISSLDIFGAVGANTVLVRSVPVTVADGQIDIQFIHEQDNPIVAAIEILSNGGGTPDVDPPTVPQNLSATAAGSNQVNLGWSASTDVGGGVVAGYKVYRADVGLVATVAGTSYSDTSVVSNTSYSYMVSAIDTAVPANESAQSSPPASVTTLPASAVALRINAGGSQYTDGVGNVWSADTGFNTGRVSTAGVGAAIAGTTDDTLYQVQRFDIPAAPELIYSIAVPNGDYTVNLHFAENYAPAFNVGARVFSVQMEGATVISSLDIFGAVGANTVLVRSVPVTVADGQIDIQFIHEQDNPIVAAIEILSNDGGTPDVDPPTVPQNLSATSAGSNQVNLGWSASTDVGGGVVAGYKVYRADVGLVATVAGTSYSDTSVVSNTSYSYMVSAIDNAVPINESAQSSPPASVTTLPASAVALRINAGGSQYTDGVGNVWSADTGFNTGRVSTAGVGAAIAGTTDDTLYQVQRFDIPAAPELIYSIAVPNGDYTVNLHFAENYAPAFNVGARVFSVQMEGATVISSLDIFGAVGANTVLVRSVPVTVADGQIDIQFIHEQDNPIVAAIEILSNDGGTPDVDPPTVPQNLSATSAGSNQVNLGWSTSTDVGGGVVAGYKVYRADVGLVATVAGTSYSDTSVVANTSYDYTVSAIDNAVPANESAQSSPPANVTTPAAPAPDTSAPTVPQNVSATAASETQVDLGWSASTDVGGGVVAGYKVYRADVGLVATVAGTSYSDTSVMSNTSYSYTVSAIDNAVPANESAQSSPAADVTTPSPDTSAPTVPQNVSATAAGSNQVNLGWSAATDVGGGVVAGYKVYRADVGLVATVAGTSYSDNSVVSNTSYSYTVSAIDNAVPANESTQSSPAANVTTPSPSALEIRVNVGGSQYTDGAGNVWSADTGFNIGLVSTAGAGAAIAGTTDDTLYQIQRFDIPAAPELTYSFAVPNGDYTVNLHFAENYSGVFSVGARVFSVQMEGATVINSLDIFGTVGANTVLVRSVPVTVADGQIDIQFIHEQDNPIVAAIEVLPADSVLPISYDFTSTDVSDWMAPSDTGIAPSWQVSSGVYRQGIDVADQSFGVPFDQSYKLGTYSYLPALTSMAGYRFSVDITPLRDLPARDPFDGQDVGVMFRYQDNDNYYRLAFSTRESFARLEKKVGGVFTTLATNARGYLEGQSFTIAVNVSGDLIQVTLDGDPLFAVSDADLSNGTVALYCQDVTAFDNVLIDVNDPNPTLVVSTPLAHSVQTGTAVTGSAAVTNMPAGGSVDFEFAGAPCAAATESSPGSGFFTADCGSAAQGDYFLPGQGLRGLLRNSSSGVVASDENLRVGIQGDQYVTIGDSITLGTFDLFSGDNQSADGRVIGQQGYQAELNDLLTASTGYPNMVFNDGIGGDETPDTLARIDSILERHPGSNRMLMMLGTNDAGGSTPINTATYQANMQSLVNTLTGQGKTVWVAKVPPALPSASNTTRNGQFQDYNTAIDSLTGIQPGPDFYAFFYDDNGTAGTSDDYERLSLFYDALHPNALGIRIMAYLWDNALTGGTTLPLFLDRLCNRLVSASCAALSPTNHKQNLLETGYPPYVDETYTLTTIPPLLADGIWIQTANAESNNTAASYIDFTVDRPVTVYVAYDAGAASLPDWLDPASSSYVDAGLDIQTTDPLSPTLHVYSRTFAAGAVSLGGNLASGAVGADSNYLTIVVPQ